MRIGGKVEIAYIALLFASLTFLLSIRPFLSVIENEVTLYQTAEDSINTKGFLETRTNQIQEFVRRREKQGEGICLSPEASVPWILDGECMEQPHISSFSRTGNRRSCGFCGDAAAYLRNLRNQIEDQYRDKCKDLVVYGAALGASYEEWIMEPGHISGQNAKVVERHGTCFFLFMTDSEGKNMTRSVDGSQHLIIIDPTKLPYENNRRNVKILKFIPGLLFPWANRVIWQDAKLLKGSTKECAPSPKGLPSDYMLHFNRTVQRFGTCSSYMGLPLNEVTVGTSPTVTLKSHCDVIIETAIDRPTVSDSLEVVRGQCEQYDNHATYDIPKVGDHYPMVDSAFIVYDMRTAACRKFNGDFGCSWLDEIQCYSDRDQISFPMVLASSGLQPEVFSNKSGHEYRDKVYINKNNIPMLHVAKRSCHWYYKSFGRCVAPDQESEEIYKNIEPYNYIKPDAYRRVAVIVAGTLQRFMFNSTLQHVIKSFRSGKLDYYVSLTTAQGKAFRADSGYTDHFQPDPILPKTVLPDHADIQDYIRTQVGLYDAASVGAVNIQESIDIDSEPMLKKRREKAHMDHPEEDPDLRFPMFDLRPDERERTANGNRNLLRLHLAVQNLWSVARKWELEEGFQYDFVIFLRDDSLWLNDFDIHKLSENKEDIFVPSCDAREPPMHPLEINDHILIARRRAADVFGNYYTTLQNMNTTKCMDRMPESLSQSGKRGCNSEMLLSWVVDEKQLSVSKIAQGDVPFQRSANVELPNGSNLQCFHKYCQSNDNPITFTGENEMMKKCKDIDWTQHFPPIAR